jgi:hypothetical protein
MPHRARRESEDRKRIRVILPDEPPELTPGAARALLRILVKAHAQATQHERTEDRPVTPTTTELPQGKEDRP